MSARTTSTRRRLPPLSVDVFVAGAVREPDARKLFVDEGLRDRARHAVQAGMEHQVGGHRQFEIEGRLLEHDAELRQRRHRIARHVVAHHLDAAGVGDEQAGEQLKQRRFAGAVRAQERDELAGAHVEADAVERPYRAVAFDDIVDVQGRECPVFRCVSVTADPCPAGLFGRTLAATKTMRKRERRAWSPIDVP